VRDGQVTAGLRPEAFEDAAFADGSLPSLDVRVEVVEELGSDTVVFFKLDVDPILVEEAVSDNADEDATTLTAGDRGLVVARVNSRTKAKVGEEITLVVDPSRLYFFSPESGESLLRGRAAAASAG
jgi:ABC-type sugar transport system ATPase subunit